MVKAYAFGAFVLAVGISAMSGDSELQARADQVFAYDRNNPRVLPAHEVRALSIAIAFRDDEGARRIMDHLRAHGLR